MIFKNSRIHLWQLSPRFHQSNLLSKGRRCRYQQQSRAKQQLHCCGYQASCQGVDLIDLVVLLLSRSQRQTEGHTGSRGRTGTHIYMTNCERWLDKNSLVTGPISDRDSGWLTFLRVTLVSRGSDKYSMRNTKFSQERKSLAIKSRCCSIKQTLTISSSKTPRWRKSNLALRLISHLGGNRCTCLPRCIQANTSNDLKRRTTAVIFSSWYKCLNFSPNP